MSTRKITVGFVVMLLVAGGVFFHLARVNREVGAELFTARSKVTLLESDLRSARQQVVALEREAAELTVRLDELGHKSTGLAATEVSDAKRRRPLLAELYRINRSELAQVQITAVEFPNGSLRPGFIELFGLTGVEVERLNAALRNARTQMTPALMPGSVKVMDGIITMEIPGSTAGANGRTQLLAEFETTLGPDRYAALTGTGGLNSIERAFRNFRGEPKRLTISREPGGYRLLEGPAGAPPGRGANIILFPSPEALPETHRWLLPHLPPLSELPVATTPATVK